MDQDRGKLFNYRASNAVHTLALRRHAMQICSAALRVFRVIGSSGHITPSGGKDISGTGAVLVASFESCKNLQRPQYYRMGAMTAMMTH